jgi:hypothetical protein
MSQRCQQETHAPQQTTALFDHELLRRCDDSKSSLRADSERAEEFRPAWQCAGSKKNIRAKRFKATPVVPLTGKAVCEVAQKTDAGFAAILDVVGHVGGRPADVDGASSGNLKYRPWSAFASRMAHALPSRRWTR